MISDTEDPDFPIWRTANKKGDHCSTLATVLFDAGAAEVTVFGKQPVLSSVFAPSPASTPAPPLPRDGQRQRQQRQAVAGEEVKGGSSGHSNEVLVFKWLDASTWEAVLRA